MKKLTWFLLILSQSLVLSQSSFEKENSFSVLNRCCESDEVLLFDLETGEIPVCQKILDLDSNDPYSLSVENAESEIYNFTSIDLYERISDTSGQNFKEENVTNFETSGFPNCTDFTILKNTKDIWFRVKGSSVEVGLRWPFDPLWMKLPQNAYCLNVINSSGTLNSYNNIESYNVVEWINHAVVLCESEIEDYRIYLISRYWVGASDIFTTVVFILLAIIYIILRRTHNVVGWLIFSVASISILYFLLSGILTIVDARWMQVETDDSCVVLYSLARYLQATLMICNLLIQSHMFLTFWKMTFRVKTINRSSSKMKIYVPIFLLLPAALVTIDQIYARNFPESEFVSRSHLLFAHGRCSPPETVFLDHILGLTVLLTLIVVTCSGIIILYLRFSSKLKSPTAKSNFVKSAMLFMKLLLGSGAPLLIRFLAFLYFGKEDPLRWYFTAIFCTTEVFTAVYYFFVFGVTKSNVKKILWVLQGKSILSYTESSAASTSTTVKNNSKHSNAPTSASNKKQNSVIKSDQTAQTAC